LLPAKKVEQASPSYIIDPKTLLKIQNFVFGVTALKKDLDGLNQVKGSINNLRNVVSTLNTVLSTKFDHVVTLLSANRENMTTFNASTAGIAGEAVKKITTLLDKTGSLTIQSDNLSTRIAEYKKALLKLEERMTQLLARYNKQFANMESMVGQSKSLKTSLTSTFEGMMASYTNK
jgi:flagellar capping protein FliD